MKGIGHIILLSLFSLVYVHTASGQYMMQDAYVTDCEGTLSDSEEGPEDGQYDHNEDFTFTICVEGATAITAIFDFFATVLSSYRPMNFLT